MAGRMGRYALWQVRDFMMGKGASFIIVAGLLGVSAYVALKGNGDAWKHSPEAASLSRQVLAGPVGVLSFFGVLLACSGIVSTDRTQGYFRFLFAKPVSLVRFYLQLWLLHGACVLALVAALTWLWGVIEVPVPVGRVVATFAVSYVLVGGITFLLSTLVRFDSLFTVALWVLAQLVSTVFADRPTVQAIVAAILPPSDHYTPVRLALASATAAVPVADLAWVLGYGVACVLIGLVVLRKRPMAS